MSEIFLKILNMSIAASYLILAVLLLRLLLKKAPKWIRVLLWGIVAFRLICPFSFESIFSLIPSAETVSPQIMTAAKPEIHTGISFVNHAVNPVISQSFAPKPTASANPLQIWTAVASIVWLSGMAAMVLYIAVSYLLVHRKVRTAVRLKENIFQSENVDSPFVLGLFKPRIYLPFAIGEADLSYVVAHEQAHIRRKDHLWKPIGFLLLTVYWFNPLLWLGYILLCRDIEFACDEKVIKEMDSESKADYSQALVSCSVHRRRIAACPLAFGEVGVKARVKSVLNYKKPAFWIILIALISCIVVAVCFLTNPKTKDEPTDAETTTRQAADEDTMQLDITLPDTKLPDTKFPNGADIINTYATGLKVYYELSDGTWQADGRIYKHRLIITGRMHKAAADSTFVYLSNLENISFDRAWKAAGFSSYKGDYFTPEEAVLVDCISGGTGETEVLIAQSGNYVVPLLEFPTGTPRENYAALVHWLTIDPGDATVPFSIWQGEKERFGSYTVFDAETYELLEFIRPSGLLPQTYVFQNADPNRSYIVLFRLDSGTQYAFGARFPSAEATLAGAAYDMPLIDSISYDIDNDGEDEMCTLTHGFTSGLPSFCIYASGMEPTAGTEYCDHYVYFGPYELSFEITTDKKLRIKGAHAEHEESVYFDIDAVKDGRIFLRCDKEGILIGHTKI